MNNRNNSALGFTWAKLVPELSVSNLSKSLAFYELLGFSVLYRRDNFVYLDFEGIQWMLQALEIDGWQVAKLTQPYGRGINFQIECSNATALHDKLKANNHPLFRELKDSWYKTGDVYSGQREFLVQDPDGYLLRFAEALGEKKTLA